MEDSCPNLSRGVSENRETGAEPARLAVDRRPEIAPYIRPGISKPGNPNYRNRRDLTSGLQPRGLASARLVREMLSSERTYSMNIAAAINRAGKVPKAIASAEYAQS